MQCKEKTRALQKKKEEKGNDGCRVETSYGDGKANMSLNELVLFLVRVVHCHEHARRDKNVFYSSSLYALQSRASDSKLFAEITTTAVGSCSFVSCD